MTSKTNPTPAAVRAWLTANAIDAPWTMVAICEGCAAETIDQRRAVRDAVRYCVGAGFIARTETKIGPVYELTGQGMPRVVLTDAERKERQRERDAGRARSGRRPQQQAVAAPKRSRAARVGMQAANTPAPSAVKATPPEGYVLVPAEPTDDMLMADAGAIPSRSSLWRAMIAARPEVSGG